MVKRKFSTFVRQESWSIFEVFTIIVELAQGGCMGLYRWNSGGQYRGKAWEQDLLADSQVRIS